MLHFHGYEGNVVMGPGTSGSKRLEHVAEGQFGAGEPMTAESVLDTLRRCQVGKREAVAVDHQHVPRVKLVLVDVGFENGEDTGRGAGAAQLQCAPI